MIGPETSNHLESQSEAWLSRITFEKILDFEIILN